MNEILNLDGGSHIHLDETSDNNAKVKVVGVGGCGCNALNRMKNIMGIKDVEFIAINTDPLSLEHNSADEKIAIGHLGAGGKPDVGRKAIMEDRDHVAEKLKGADIVFIAAGMGGGTGTGAAPVVAQIAKELGILTVAVVTVPFKIEGPVRNKNAKIGLAAIKSVANTTLAVNNQYIYGLLDKNATMEQAYLKLDEVLGNAVRGICDIMLHYGTVQVDFADVRTVMIEGGTALMGTGVAEGEDRALIAAEAAISCPLLGEMNLKGATNVLVNISHGENFLLSEQEVIMSSISDAVGIDPDDEFGDTNVFMGDCTIKELGDKISVTVIVTGFDKAQAGYAPVQQQVQAVEQPQPSVQMPRLEQSTPRPTTNFAAMLDVPQVPQPAFERPEAPTIAMERVAAPAVERPYTGFGDASLDVRNATVREEVLVQSGVQAQPQAMQQPPVSARQQAYVQPPQTSVQGTSLEPETNSVCPRGMDLRTPAWQQSRDKRELAERDTRSMESFRNSFASGGDF